MSSRRNTRKMSQAQASLLGMLMQKIFGKHTRVAELLLVAMGIGAGAIFVTHEEPVVKDGKQFECPSPRVVDGDTLRCGELRVRLQAIDAPEKNGKCQKGRTCVEGDGAASTRNLEKLVSGHRLQCEETDKDRYGRTVARCRAGKVDLSCSQVEGGFAVERYGKLICDKK